MLSELFIRNFAIIEDLRMRFATGFNVLTGETGAGKSIILDAMMLLVGERADTSMIRAGCTDAYVEATFKLDEAMQRVIQPLLEEEGLEHDEGPHLLVLARELRMTGRNINRVNGRSASLSLLRDLASPLVDIHGQGEHLSLLKPRSHLPLLDAYAGLVEERRELSKEVLAYQKIQHELNELRRNERMLAQRADMLRYQIQEIEAANLKEGEEEDLREERTRLANAEQLLRHANEAVTLLTGVGMAEDDFQSVADMMGQAERSLVQLARYDDSKGPLLETLQGLIYQISEVSSDLQSYLDELEFNPGRLDFVEERIELINRLKRKYGDSITAILETGVHSAAELEKIDNSEERIQILEGQQTTYLRKIGQMAAALSAKRQQAATRLATAVEGQLADLHMDGSRFEVDFQREPKEDGAFVGDERLAFDQSGIDKAEFVISANPGEPLKPMAKVASGGETARLMLALKTALAQVDSTPTLIFDEIDQGIGGRVGDVVGRKLWGLTAVADHQVIVVTHLPQLAGYGDLHYHVSKRVQDGRTLTHIDQLDENGRVRELAAMLGTAGDHAIGGAKTILQSAAAAKRP